MTNALVVIVVVGLGAYRFTRLVTTDTITAGLRRRLHTLFPSRTVPLYDDAGRRAEGDIGTLKPRWIVELVNCSWCTGWWVAGGLMVAAHFVNLVSWHWTILGWPAAATVAGVVDEWVERAGR